MSNSTIVYFDHSNSEFAQSLEDNYGFQLNTVYYPFLQFRNPLIACIFYLLTVFFFRPASPDPDAPKKAKKPTGPFLRAFMFLHNSALCIFSVLCFYDTAPIAFDMLFVKGWKHSTCERGWWDEFEGTFGFWAYLFYLSKYYEFIDTWIVMAKGRRPMFLQVNFCVWTVECSPLHTAWPLSARRWVSPVQNTTSTEKQYLQWM